jgi:hypothetical protein
MSMAIVGPLRTSQLDEGTPTKTTSMLSFPVVLCVLFLAGVNTILTAVLLANYASSSSAASASWLPGEGMLAGVTPSLTAGRPKLIMAVDIDYPPYAYVRTAPFTNRTDLDEVIGVGVDMITAMADMCGFDVTVMEAHWSDCWGNGEIGRGLLEGWYHGCMTYTHAAAVRNRYLDFTYSWARPNKPSGLITRLVNGASPPRNTNPFAAAAHERCQPRLRLEAAHDVSHTMQSCCVLAGRTPIMLSALERPPLGASNQVCHTCMGTTRSSAAPSST